MSWVEDVLEAHACGPCCQCSCGWQPQPIVTAIGVSPAVAHRAHLANEFHKLIDDPRWHSIGAALDAPMSPAIHTRYEDHAAVKPRPTHAE